MNWTVTDSYNAQSLCAYEEVALGYSAFCGLFTYEEWQGYEYSVDISFAGNNAFQSPTGRAVGVGYVEEFIARIQHHVITEPTAQINVTLDNNTATFPIHQTLNFDFSHDTNMYVNGTTPRSRQILTPSIQYGHHHRLWLHPVQHSSANNSHSCQP